MEILWAIGLGSGLAAASSFRAIFPLVLVSFTKVVDFPPALEWLTTTPALLVFLILLVGEFLIDELPGVGFFHSSAYSGVKVLIGGVLFASAVNMNPWIGIFLGGILTGFFVLARFTYQPLLQKAQPYFRNLSYDKIENIASVVLAIIAIASPGISLLTILGMIFIAVRTGQRVG